MVPKNVLDAARFAAEKMQKINLYETPNFFCDVYCLEPGQEQKAHLHDDADKIYYVIEGTGTVLVGETEHQVAPHEIILAPAGAMHGVRNLSSNRLMLLVLMSPNPNVSRNA